MKKDGYVLLFVGFLFLIEIVVLTKIYIHSKTYAYQKFKWDMDICVASFHVCVERDKYNKFIRRGGVSKQQANEYLEKYGL